MLTPTATAQLIHSENQFRSAFKFSAIGMALADRWGALLEVNNSLCKMMDYSSEELVLHTFQDITHPDDLETDLQLFHELLEGQRESYQMEKRYIRRNGHIVWALLTVSIVRDEEGNIVHLIKQIQDITKLKLKDQLLIQSENQFRSAFEFSAIGMALANPAGKLIQVNNSLCKMIGYSPAELLTYSFQELTHSDDLQSDLDLLNELMNGQRESYQMEKRFIHREGHIVWVLLAVSIVRDEQGSIVHLVNQIQDISSLKEKEAVMKMLNQSISETNNKLVHNNRELEQFAFIASHDLQEPLRMVTGFLSRIEKKYHSLLDEEGKKYIHFAMDGASRMRMLIIDILNYSGLDNQDKQKLVPVDLNHLVGEILILNKPLLEGGNAEIEMDDLPVITANATSMQQLFSNLITNAIKYQSPENKPIVKIKVFDKTDHWLFAIEDNGIGIDKRGTGKVFDIFQRLHSKEQYSGTGIGLAICKKIVENLMGKIWVESTPGVGSIFYFTIGK